MFLIFGWIQASLFTHRIVFLSSNIEKHFQLQNIVLDTSMIHV